MGLFDDQLKARLEQDRESFADALEALGESVTGKCSSYRQKWELGGCCARNPDLVWSESAGAAGPDG